MVLAPWIASGQTHVTLPDSAQSTTLTAAVAEQADVSVPASVTWTVSDINAGQAEPNLDITITNIVLATATKQLRMSLQANAATFTAPAGAPTTYNASDVSWSFTGGSPWVNGSGVSGTLSHLTYNTVATCNADVSSCNTTRLKLDLAANATIRRSGNYTLVMTWKFESIGT